MWITEKISSNLDARKKAKNSPEYVKNDKEIRRKCCKETEKWCKEKCDEIEENQKLNATKKMHDSIKELAGIKKAAIQEGAAYKIEKAT